MAYEQLGHVPYQPGDIIKDKESGIDLIVQSVIPPIAGAGLVVYAVRAYDSAVERFTWERLNDIIVKKRSSGASPTEVLESLWDLETRIAGGRQDLSEALHADRMGRALRDVLWLAYDTPLLEQEPLKDVIKSVIGVTQEVPSTSTMFNILSNAVGADSDYTEEFLWYLSEELHEIALEGTSRMRQEGTVIGKWVSTEGDIEQLFRMEADRISNFQGVRIIEHAGMGHGVAGEDLAKFQAEAIKYVRSSKLETEEALRGAISQEMKSRGMTAEGALFQRWVDDQLPAAVSAAQAGRYHPLFGVLVSGDRRNRRDGTWITEWTYTNRSARRSIFNTRLEGALDTSAIITNLQRGEAAAAADLGEDEVARGLAIIDVDTFANDIARSTDRDLARKLKSKIEGPLLLEASDLMRYRNLTPDQFTEPVVEEIVTKQARLRQRLGPREVRRLTRADRTTDIPQAIAIWGGGQAAGPQRVFIVNKADGSFEVMRLDDLRSRAETLGDVREVRTALISARDLRSMNTLGDEYTRRVWEAETTEKLGMAQGQGGEILDPNQLQRFREEEKSLFSRKESIRRIKEVGDYVQDMRGSYYNMYENRNIGVAVVSDLSNQQLRRVRVVGSELSISLEEQYRRIQNLKNLNTGAIMDIETKYVTSGGKRRLLLKQASIRGRDKGILDLETIGATAEKQIEAVRNITKSLESSSVDVVGTQTNYDIRSLIEIARSHGDEETVRRLQAVQEGKVVNIDLLYQLDPNRTITSVNQEEMMRFYGLGQHVHEAKRDVISAWKLLDMIEAPEVEFHTGDISNLKLYSVAEQRRSAGAHLKLLLGVDSVNREGKNVYRMHYGFVSDTGELTGKAVRESENLYSLLSMFASEGGVIEATDLGGYSELLRMRRADYASRRMRSLNPFSRSVWFEGWEPGRDRLFGISQIMADEITSQQLLGLREAVEAQVAAADPITEATARNAAAIQVASEYVSRLNGFSEGQRALIEDTMVRALIDPQFAGTINDPEYIKFRSSFFVRHMLGLQPDQAAGEAAESTIEFLSQSRADDAALFWVKAMENYGHVVLQDSQRLSEPRMTIRLLGQDTRGVVGLRTGGVNLAETTSEAISEVILSMSDPRARNEKNVAEFLKRAGLNDQEIQELKHLSARYRNVNKIVTDDDFYTFARELHLEDESSELGKISEYHRRLMQSSEVRLNVRSTIERTLDTVERRTLSAESVKQFREILADEWNKSGDNITFANEALRRMREADQNLYGEMLREPYESIDTSVLANLSQEEVNLLGREVEKLKGDLHALGISPDDFLRDLTESMSAEGWRTRVEMMRNIPSLIEDMKRRRLSNVGAAATAARQVDNVTKDIPSLTEVFSKLAATARRVANEEIDPGATMRTVAELSRDVGAQVSKRITQTSTLPLVTLGGAIGAMAAFGPRSDDFSQGEQSMAMQNQIARWSEVPGNEVNQGIWVGQEEPFRISVNIKGFVKSKQHQEALIQQVYNAISGVVEFRAISTDIRDMRERSHKIRARERI